MDPYEFETALMTARSDLSVGACPAAMFEAGLDILESDAEEGAASTAVAAALFEVNMSLDHAGEDAMKADLFEEATIHEMMGAFVIYCQQHKLIT